MRLIGTILLLLFLWSSTGRPADAQTPDPVNLTALWFDQSQAGHGVSVVHQGSILFVAWYTYGSDGKVLWLIAAASRQADGRYVGALNSFNGQPFNLISNAQANTATQLRGEARLTVQMLGSKLIERNAVLETGAAFWMGRCCQKALIRIVAGPDIGM